MMVLIRVVMIMMLQVYIHELCLAVVVAACTMGDRRGRATRKEMEEIKEEIKKTMSRLVPV